MSSPRDLRSFLGNAGVVEILRRAIRLDRLPHAMIFAGPSGTGKRTLARLIAQLLNCLSPVEEDVCGACRSCRKILAASHPDVRELAPDGTVIRIEQVRALIGEIAFQPFEGKYRVAILDGADQMRTESANSLLKTIEEPPSRTFIVLVTTNPYALLDTIRSRCRMLQFGGIPNHQIERYLLGLADRSRDAARLAASFSNGSLSAALSFKPEEFLERRNQALRFLRLFFQPGKFSELSSIAAALAKDKEGFLVWMDAIAMILRDVYFAQVSPQRVPQEEILPELKELAVSTARGRLLSGIEAFNKLRRSLNFNVNRQLALESLYLALSRT